MNDENNKILIEKVLIELRRIAKALEKFVNEGITIYQHEDGDETKN